MSYPKIIRQEWMRSGRGGLTEPSCIFQHDPPSGRAIHHRARVSEHLRSFDFFVH